MIEVAAEKTSLSYELFPPKKNFDLPTLVHLISELGGLKPDYISITYGAGGTARDNKTLEMCRLIKQHTDTKPVAHVTAVGSTQTQIEDVLNGLLKLGVRDLLALRGDPNPDITAPGDFRYAGDLISFIQTAFPNTFNLYGACYPVGHFESKSQKEDIFNLKKKVEAGATTLITQLFFDNNELYHFLELIDIADIKAQVHAGIMPLTSKKQIAKMVSLSGASVPAKLSRLIAKYGDDDTSMQQAGINYATEQIVDLLSCNIHGIHLYTMNHLKTAQKITANIKDLL